jgi:hypothetical protein
MKTTLGRKTQAQAKTYQLPSEINRDPKLETAIFKRYEAIGKLLEPEAKTRLARLSRQLLDQIVKRSKPGNLERAAHTVKKQFARLTADQTDLLGFWALADVAQFAVRKVDRKGKRSNLESAAGETDLDSMSEMTEMETMRLQMAMDRRSKMMSTLSNIMKNISETANSIVQNLK